MSRRPIAGPAMLAGVVVFLLGGCATSLSRSEIATEYYNIGSAYFELGELDKSATYLGRAIELEPELARASYNLARVYVLQRRYDEALDLLVILLEEDPDNALVMETIGYAYYQADDLSPAAEWYDRALAENPTDAELLQNRATVALQAGDPQAAASALERALRVVDDDAEIYLRFARAQRALDDSDGAAESYREYLDLVETPQPAALAEYARVLEAGEFYADALSVLEELTELPAADQESRARAHFSRARLLLTEAQEAEPGVQALTAALAAGFADEEAFERLLAHDDLVARSEVEELIAAATAAPSDGPPPDDPAGPGTDGEMDLLVEPDAPPAEGE